MQSASDQRTGVQTPKFSPLVAVFFFQVSCGLLGELPCAALVGTVVPGACGAPVMNYSIPTGGCYPATPSHVAVMLLGKPETPAPAPLLAFTHEAWRASRPMGGKIVPQHVQVKQGKNHAVLSQIVDAGHCLTVAAHLNCVCWMASCVRLESTGQCNAAGWMAVAVAPVKALQIS